MNSTVMVVRPGCAWHSCHMSSALDEFARSVKVALGDRSRAGTATAAGLPRDAISSVLSGHEPKLSRVAEVCDAVGLEFYVGPARVWADADGPSVLSTAALRDLETSARVLNRVVIDAGGDPLPDELRAPAPASLAVSDAFGVAAANEDGLPPGSRSMGAREVEVAAGGGAVNIDEAPEKGRLWFRRDWLDRHGIDTTQCVVISVRGESMEPTLPDGCSILVDRSRTRRRAGGIFVIDAEDGLIVKRLGKAGRRWLLVSDHPSWSDVPWPQQATVIGEVRWASRTFK